MTTFDVFIKGIRPDHLGKSESVIQEASRYLNIERQKIEEMSNAPSPSCIFRGLSEQQAQEHQANLYTIGIICLYKPGKQAAGLSLVAVDIDDDGANMSACPKCEQPLILTNGETPKTCSACGVLIEKYIEIQKREEQKEEIRQRLLKSQNSKKALEAKERQKQLQEKLKKELEEEILDENPELKENKSKLPIIIGLGLVTLVGGVVFFIASDSTNNAPAANMATESGNLPNSATVQATSTPPQTSQEALQKAHDQSTQVLDAFNINADAFAGGAGSNNNSDLAIANTASDNEPHSKQMLNPVKQQSMVLTNGLDDKEWERFLLRQIEQQINANNINAAYSLSTRIKSTANYVKALKNILANIGQAEFDKNISPKIIAKINVSPINAQAQLFAQVALLQTGKQQSALFERAEAVWAELATPEQQLNAGLVMAVSYAKAGNISLANQYFRKISGLLGKIKSIDQKISAHVAVGLAYKEVGRKSDALPWLAKAKKLLRQALVSVGLQAVVNGYVALGDVQTVQDLIGRVASKQQDKLFYNAINAALDVGLMNDAQIYARAMSLVSYKALAYTLLESSYFPLVDILLENEINNPVDQVIVSSRLAQSYAMQGNDNRVKALVQSVKDQMNMLEAGEQKDSVLKVIAINFAHAFKFDFAQELTSFIQQPSVAENVLQEIKALNNLR